MKLVSFLFVVLFANLTWAATADRPKVVGHDIQGGGKLTIPEAKIPVVAADPSSGFGQVLASFDNGQDAKWSDVKGFWIGRCFTFANQNVAKNSMLGYFLIRDPGPAFPDGDAYLGAITYAGKPADHFDKMTDYELEISQTESQLWSLFYAEKTSVVTEEPTVTVLDDLEPNKRPDFKTEYRVSGNTVVRRTTNLISQNLIMSGSTKKVPVRAGQVLISCSYSKQVAR